MTNFRRFLALSIAMSISASLLAVGVVGKWKGKVVLDVSKLPKAQNEQQKKSMEAGFAMVKKMVIILDLKANKTYTGEAKNMPGGQPDQRSEGTWRQEGNVLWLTSIRDNGKPATDKKPQKFLIQDKGRKLVMAESKLPPGIEIFFSR
jgi:hypothetical protein